MSFDTHDEGVELVLTMLFATLLLLVLAGVVVVLMVAHRNRRNRHRAELAVVRMEHAEEVRRVEQEMVRETLGDVGRELHDNIGQLLTVVRLGLNSMSTDPVNAEGAQLLKANLDTTIGEVRRLSRSLDPDRFSRSALTRLVAEECERVGITAQRQVVFQVQGPEPPINPDRNLVVFRLFQEALNNALKHTRVGSISVNLQFTPSFTLTVLDSGPGFDVSAERASGSGMEHMRKRAALINCSFTLISSPAQGTLVSFVDMGISPVPSP